jgi:hypothetical protein
MNARMNTNLARYTVFLLLSGDRVSDYQRKFTDFVRQLDESDTVSAIVRSQFAVQRMADDMTRGLEPGGFILALGARIRELRGEQSI